MELTCQFFIFSNERKRMWKHGRYI